MLLLLLLAAAAALLFTLAPTPAQSTSPQPYYMAALDPLHVPSRPYTYLRFHAAEP